MANVCGFRVIDAIASTFNGHEIPPTKLPHEPEMYFGREGSVGDSNTISVEKRKLLVEPTASSAPVYRCRHCGGLYVED